MTVLPTFMTLIHASYQEFCRSIGVVAKISPPPPHKNGPGLDFSPGKASYRFPQFFVLSYSELFGLFHYQTYCNKPRNG